MTPVLVVVEYKVGNIFGASNEYGVRLKYVHVFTKYSRVQLNHQRVR